MTLQAGTGVDHHTGSGADGANGRPLAPQPSRINNRAPLRPTEIPFEAIPLEEGNSAAAVSDIRRPPAIQQQQLPFGVSLNRPPWPTGFPASSATNIQGMPFASGVPLPVQLVPPVSNRPLPLPPNGRPLTLTESKLALAFNSTTEQPTTTSTYSNSEELELDHHQSHHQDEYDHSAQVDWVQSSYVRPEESSESAVYDYDFSSAYAYPSAQVPSYSFVPEEASSSLIVVQPTSHWFPTSSSWTSSSLLPLPSLQTVIAPGVESVLLPSIEDVTSAIRRPVSVSPPPPPRISSTPPVAVPVAATQWVVQRPSTTTTTTNNNNAGPVLEAAYPLPSPPPYSPPTPGNTTPGGLYGYTPPLPAGQDSRPGQVFADDVITSENIRPQRPGYGDTFELVVTANQNFGGNQQPQPQPGPGRPYVIPVDIEQVRNPTAVASQVPAGGAAGAGGPGDDQFVSIDGRKTYFNLFPTDGPEVVSPSQPAFFQPTTAPNRYPQVRT